MSSARVTRARMLLRRLLRKSGLYFPLRTLRSRRYQTKELETWERSGRPAPAPHIIKQRVLVQYAEQHKLRILVETGTCHGDMVYAMKDKFDQVFSIELSQPFYEECCARFRGDKHIVLVHGDSADQLQTVIARINKPVPQPALFWLDGHYSGADTAKGNQDTPIYAELEQILTAAHPDSVVVIDDARLFGTDPSYPKVSELRTLVSAKRPNSEIDVEHDSIRITPTTTRSGS
jgi:hypothetical protein